MAAGQDQGASFLSDIVQSQTTGGPQTRQLCARKARLNDTHSFVDLWIGPTTRRYSSIAAPNTQVRIQSAGTAGGERKGVVMIQVSDRTMETGRRRAWTGRHFFSSRAGRIELCDPPAWRKLYKQATTCFHVRFRYREPSEHSSEAR